MQVVAGSNPAAPTKLEEFERPSGAVPPMPPTVKLISERAVQLMAGTVGVRDGEHKKWSQCLHEIWRSTRVPTSLRSARTEHSLRSKVPAGWYTSVARRGCFDSGLLWRDIAMMRRAFIF